MISEFFPLFILIGSLVFDLLLGEFPNKFHPVVWMGTYIKFLWSFRFRKSSLTLFFWGCLIVCSGVSIFTIIPILLLKFLPLIFSLLLAILMLTSVFSIKALIKAGKEVKMALEQENLNEARELTAWHLVSRDMSELEEEEIVSAVIESLAENITDGFFSPLFYFSLGGIPAAWAYRFINTSDSLIAYRKDDFEWGGKMTAWCDSVLNWIPSRLTGLIICFSAFIVGEDWKNSLKVMLKQHRKTSSPNAGWTMAAMTGALNIQLEKKGEYLLDGGNKVCEFQLIDRAIKIVITSIIVIILFSIILLEVLN